MGRINDLGYTNKAGGRRVWGNRRVATVLGAGVLITDKSSKTDSSSCRIALCICKMKKITAL
jgi:hypothetical protein